MKLSIIIPSFKRPELLKWGLYSLSKQTILFNYEIIVLNDGIKDDTEQICNQFKEKLNIRYIFTGQRNKEKIQLRSPGFVINIGVKLSKGEFIIISSPEMYILDDNLINKMINNLMINDKVLVISKGLDDIIRWEKEAGFLKHIITYSGNIQDYNNYNKMVKLNTKLPFFIGMKKQYFIDIGGYDEDFIGYCFDDEDLVSRLLKNGCNYIILDSTVIHLYHSRKKRDIKNLWNYNKELYENKKNIIIRNKNKEWGKFEENINNKTINEKKVINKISIIDEQKMISIIMTTFNRCNLLPNSLNSIVCQPKPKNVEILIVDDGSTDNTKKVVKQYQEKYPEWNIRYIYRYKQQLLTNPAIALNIALIYAKGSIIIQSGVDLLHIGNVIENLLINFRKEEAYYACRLLKLKLAIMANFPTEDKEKIERYVKENGIEQSINPIVKDIDKNNALPFCAIYRKEWAYKIGLFDEEYLPGGAEDRDFVYRMQKIVPTRWCYNIWVCHQGHKKFAGEPLFLYGYNKNYLRSFNTTEGRDNRKRFKILFIGNFNLFPFPGYLWDSLKQSFMRLGHYCKFYDPQPESLTDEDLKNNVHKSAKYWRNPDTLVESQKITDEFKPDVIITATAGQWLISKQLKTNALKVAWFGDLRTSTSYTKFRNDFDCLFITNEEQVKTWKEYWNCPVFPISFAALDTGHYRLPIDQTIEVGFAGKNHKNSRNHPGYTNRMDLLEKIDNKFYLEVLSNAWIKTQEFYSKCKIVISDSHDDSVNTRGYSSNRFFNIVSCGSFCLVRYFPGLELWGEDGKHFVIFKTNEEALEKIEYYLNNPDERQKIADAGYKWFHTQFNWMRNSKYMSGIFEHLIERKNK